MTVNAPVCAALLLSLVGIGLLVAATVPAAANPLAEANAGELVKYYVVQHATGTPAPSTPSPANSPAGGEVCTATQPAKIRSDRARQRVAVEQAWDRTQGEGILAAIVDSGVDASLAQLAGRVAQGADILAGSGRGNVDCLGSGTAMASILAARIQTGGSSPAASEADATASGDVVGMAPALTILPIRVVTHVPRPRPADAVTAIEVAASGGAKVIALGSYVDVAGPGVVRAMQRAQEHDVVVVAAVTEPGASASVRSALPELPKLPGVLRVAGVGPEGQAVAAYRPGQVAVTAPGMDVASLGAGNTGVWVSSGSRYAVAIAGGVAALVRSAFPHLNVAQVVHRVEVTADGRGAEPRIRRAVSL